MCVCVEMSWISTQWLSLIAFLADHILFSYYYIVDVQAKESDPSLKIRGIHPKLNMNEYKKWKLSVRFLLELLSFNRFKPTKWTNTCSIQLHSHNSNSLRVPIHCFITMMRKYFLIVEMKFKPSKILYAWSRFKNFKWLFFS